MMEEQIKRIVVHCSATQNGKALGSSAKTAAEVIDGWHKQRGFKRKSANVQAFNPHLGHIGYHFVIDCDGSILTGRKCGEVGAHAKGFNTGSIGICLVGGVTKEGKNHGAYTAAQWDALASLLKALAEKYAQAEICGHRDLSPDRNGDGKITRNEWLKDCPCFDVLQWLDSGEVINNDHLFI